MTGTTGLHRQVTFIRPERMKGFAATMIMNVKQETVI